MSTIAYTADEIVNSTAPLKIEGFTVKDGRFDQVFNNESTFKNYIKRNNCPLVNFSGKTVMPGQVDAHNIATFISRFSRALSLKGVHDKVTFKTRLKEMANTPLPSHGFLFCTNWTEETMPLNKTQLNEITEKPTVIFNSSFHGALANDSALSKLAQEGFFKEIEQPEDGLLKGPSYDAFVLYTSPTQTDFGLNIVLYERELLAKGVTTVHDLVVQKPEELKIIAILTEKGMLKARWRVYVTNINLLHKPPQTSDAFKIMGVKLFVDGSYGMKTAWQDKAHAYSDGSTGMAKLTKEDIIKTAEKTAELGYTHLAAHCIGYQACKTFLDAAEKIRASIYTKEMTLRALHFETVDKNLINRAQELNICVSMQPAFSEDVTFFAKDIPQPADVNPMRDVASSLKDKFCLGSDSMPHGLLENAKLCLMAPLPSQKITENFVKLLPYLTRSAARLTNEHNSFGAIKVGQSADFVVTNKCPLSAKDLNNTSVEQTWLRGEQVFTKTQE